MRWHTLLMRRGAVTNHRNIRTGTAAMSIVVVAIVTIVGCGDNGEPQTAVSNTVGPSLIAVATTTTAAPVAATTTAPPPPASTTPSTAAPTSTTIPVLPIPEPPPEARIAEPEINLGAISIPKINMTQSLYQGISLTTLDRGPGHWPGTAMPGQFGNAVIAGHRTSHAKPFRNLDQLVPGDQVIFDTADGHFVYEVTGTEIVTPDDLWIINQTPGYTATLFACHPVGSTKERIVVHLQLSSQ